MKGTGNINEINKVSIPNWMAGRGSTDGLILLDARVSFCTVEPDARTHVRATPEGLCHINLHTYNLPINVQIKRVLVAAFINGIAVGQPSPFMLHARCQVLG